MKDFNDMTPAQRLAVLRKNGVSLFPKLSDAEKKVVLYIENEPALSAQTTEPQLSVH